MPFNRTFKELKFGYPNVANVLLIPFNRTFKELKYTKRNTEVKTRSF